jgi:hypothetical protein
MQETDAKIEKIKGRYRPSTYCPNFMAAILCATGQKKAGGNIERVFSSLCVKQDSTGKYVFNSGTTTSKIVIFYSNKYPDDLDDNEKYTFMRQSNLNVGQDDSLIGKVNGQSHTEPLCLAAILSLNKGTFKNMLSSGYSLLYYEIHLMSLYDACVSCPEKIYNSMKEIKVYFEAQELFMFYHGCKSYIKYGYDQSTPRKRKPSWDAKPYAVKFKGINIRAKFNLNNYCITVVKDDSDQENLISDLIDKQITFPIEENITDVAEYYFAFIYELERSNIITKEIRTIKVLKPE